MAHLERGLVYAAARDITEQKQAEACLEEARLLQEKLQRQLILADRMATVGTLAAGAAHEINNPLAFVAGNISLILEELKDLTVASPSNQLREMTEMAVDVRAGAERIRKIVRGLNAFSRTGQERHEVIDVHQLLELSIDMALGEIRHHARLVKEYGTIPMVTADEARLGQVFINLLVNAAQSLPEGDNLASEIRIVTSTNPSGEAVIEFRDSGRGIPENLIDRIFDPFFTTRSVGAGTGLGLSISHNIVSSLGGRILVVSQEGHGATFTVVLPASATAVAHLVSSDAEPMEIRLRGNVLVVDADPSVGVVMARILRRHAVTTTPTTREALELLASGQDFQVILSDLTVPEMSGMDFYDQVARRFPALTTRVVFVSGGPLTAAASAFLDRVANERIEKPFDLQAVRELVQRFVG